MVSKGRSIAMRIAAAGDGNPTDCKTMIMVTIPALGIPGAPEKSCVFKYIFISSPNVFIRDLIRFRLSPVKMIVVSS